MTTVQAIVLGALQGATEFLPVSSSGHLVITKEIFGAATVPVLFDVLLHVATLVAVVIVLRRQVWLLLRASLRWMGRRTQAEDRPYLRLIPLIVVTTGITGGIGVFFDSRFDIRNPVVTSLLFLVTAGFLIATRWARGDRPLTRIRWVDTLVLGVAQGFGVLPGISRSGITISTALYTGMDRGAAGEYSFLLSIPAILGALVLTLGDAGELGAQVGTVPILAGFLSAMMVGFFALTLLMKIVRAGRISLFALYLIPLGIWGLITFA